MHSGTPHHRHHSADERKNMEVKSPLIGLLLNQFMKLTHGTQNKRKSAFTLRQCIAF